MGVARGGSVDPPNPERVPISEVISDFFYFSPIAARTFYRSGQRWRDFLGSQPGMAGLFWDPENGTAGLFVDLTWNGGTFSGPWKRDGGTFSGPKREWGTQYKKLTYMPINALAKKNYANQRLPHYANHLTQSKKKLCQTTQNIMPDVGMPINVVAYARRVYASRGRTILRFHFISFNSAKAVW